MSHEDLKSKVCPVCNKNFEKVKNLKAHYDSVHLKLKQAQCDFCGTSFRHKRNLMRHCKHAHPDLTSKQHEGIKDTNGPGTQSYNGGNDNSDIDNDNSSDDNPDNTDMDIQPYQCGICDQYFAHTRQLQTHYDTVHFKVEQSGPTSKPHLKLDKAQCQFCNQLFRCKISLLRHIRKFHPKLTTKEQKINVDTAIPPKVNGIQVAKVEPGT